MGGHGDRQDPRVSRIDHAGATRGESGFRSRESNEKLNASLPLKASVSTHFRVGKFLFPLSPTQWGRGKGEGVSQPIRCQISRCDAPLSLPSPPARAGGEGVNRDTARMCAHASSQGGGGLSSSRAALRYERNTADNCVWICTVLDMLAEATLPVRGFVRQEDTALTPFSQTGSGSSMPPAQANRVKSAVASRCGPREKH